MMKAEVEGLIKVCDNEIMTDKIMMEACKATGLKKEYDFYLKDMRMLMGYRSALECELEKYL